MPKRKHQDSECGSLRKKLKKIEKKLRRNQQRRRVLTISESSEEGVQDRDTAKPTSHVAEEQVALRAPRLVPALTASATAPAPAPVPAPSTSSAAPVPHQVEHAASVPHRTDHASPISDIAFVDLAPELGDSSSQAEILPDLEADVLETLGIDPTNTNKYGKDIQKDLAIRFEHGVTQGLSKENRKELVELYLIPNNCKLLDPPILNPELKAALTEQVIKRDKAIEAKQKVSSAALSSLGRAITHILSSKDKDTELLRMLMDTGRMVCDSQHSDTQTRRNYVISSIKKEMKESLQNSKIDSFLFGQALTDTLKAAKAINKSGAELKVNTISKPGSSKKFSSAYPKNWKGNAPRKPATAPRETARPTTIPTPTKTPRAGYSRASRDQRAPRTRR